MNASSEKGYAELALRLLLGVDHSEKRNLDALNEMQWDVFFRLARKNVILVRIHDRLEQLGILQGTAFREAAIKERERIDSTIDLIGQVSEICAQEGTPFVMTKAFQHYPDMGHDVDLFVSDQSQFADHVLIKRLGLTPGKNSILNRIAGKTSYECRGSSSPLEIHHGRLGHLGEHNVFPLELVRNRQLLTIAGISTYVPCPEDQLILQTIQRIYGHFVIRISDVVQSVKLIQKEALNWDYIIRTARKIGVLSGLVYYLDFVDQIYRTLGQKSLLPEEIHEVFPSSRRATIRFIGLVYRFPILGISGRAYYKKLVSDLFAGNWEASARLFLLPPIATLVTTRDLVQRQRTASVGRDGG